MQILGTVLFLELAHYYALPQTMTYRRVLPEALEYCWKHLETHTSFWKPSWKPLGNLLGCLLEAYQNIWGRRWCNSPNVLPATLGFLPSVKNRLLARSAGTACCRPLRLLLKPLACLLEASGSLLKPLEASWMPLETSWRPLEAL